MNKQEVQEKLKGINFINYFDEFLILDKIRVYYEDITNINLNYEMIEITIKNTISIKILK